MHAATYVASRSMKIGGTSTTNHAPNTSNKNSLLLAKQQHPKAFHQKLCLFDPRSKGLTVWDVVVCVFVLWTILVGPLDMSWRLCHTCKKSNDPGRAPLPEPLWSEDMQVDCNETPCLLGIIDSISDLIFIIDLFVVFRTILIYQVRGQELVITDSGMIAKEYIKLYFFFDLFSIGIPFMVILEGNGFLNNQIEKVFKQDAPHVFRWIFAFRLLKVVRLTKLSKLLSRLADVTPDKQLYVRIAKLVAVMLLLAHLIACLFWFVACDEHGTPIHGSWITSAGIQNTDIFTQYIACLYFALMTLTTVGYGDISPNTSNEMIFTCVVMVIGTFVYVAFVGCFTNWIDSENRNRQVVQDRMETLECYCNSFDISPKLTKKILQTLKYKWSLYNSLNEQILDDLPDTLRTEVLVAMYHPVLLKVSLFRTCDEHVIKGMARHLRLQVCMPGTEILVAGDPGSEMYILQSGKCDVVSLNQRVMRRLGGGDFFGVLQGFLENVVALETVISTDKCEYMSLSRENLYEILQYYPRITAKIYKNLLVIVESELNLTEENDVVRNGQFVVKVLEASNLMCSDIDSSSDPFCVVEILGTHKKTRIRHDTLSPVWDEVFVYDLLDLYQRYFAEKSAPAIASDDSTAALNKTKDQFLSFLFDKEQSQLSKEYVYEKLRNEQVKNVNLKVSVYDKDNFDNDDFLGSCTVNIDRFVDGAEKRLFKTKWFPLENVPDESASQIHLTIESRYRSFDNRARKLLLEDAVQRIKTKLTNNDFSAQTVSKSDLEQLWSEMSLVRMQVDTLERHLNSQS